MTMTDDNTTVSPPASASASASGVLTRLSASPASSSTSSLTSSSSFDPHAHPDAHPDDASSKGKGEPGPSTILGLRELARMRKDEKRARQAVVTTTTTTEEVDPRPPKEIKLLSSVFGSDTQLPFAVDAQILGWKVVGGKSWTDLGRIGAYVGMSLLHGSSLVPN